MPLRAGELNRRVTIQQRAAGQDSVGGPLNTWTDVKQVWAAIEPFGTRERLLAQSVQSEVSHTVSIRYDPMFADPKIVASYRLSYTHRGVTRIFEISGVKNEDEGDHTLTLMCSEGVTEG